MPRIAVVVNHKFLSLLEESKKMIKYFRSRGCGCRLYNADDFLPYKPIPRREIREYDLVIFFSPFQRIEVVHSRYLPLEKTISYYVVEGIAKHIEIHRRLLEKQVIVTPSNFSKQCIEESGFKVDRVIPHIADPDPDIDYDYGREWRNKYPRDKKILLYVGNPVRRKGLPELRKAVEILGRRRRDFIVVLHTADQPRLAGYSVKQLEHPNIVLELEYGRIPRSRVLGKILYADYYIHPAKSEGFGLPVLEALQLGTPVIAVDAPGVNEIVNERNAFIAPSRGVEYADYPDPARALITFKMAKYDPRDLADVIDQALDAKSDELYNKVAEGWRTVEKYRDTYKEFISIAEKIHSGVTG